MTPKIMNDKTRMGSFHSWTLVFFSLVLVSFGVPTVSDEPVERPDLSGVWLDPLITFDDPRWCIEDVLCERCNMEAVDYLRSLLADPANDEKPLEELEQMAFAYDKKSFISRLTKKGKKQSFRYDQEGDPVIDCKDSGGLYLTVLSPIPIRLEQYSDRVVLTYEYFNSVRTVYTDGREHPSDLQLSLLGHSIGWYDGDSLVVETRGIQPNLYAMNDTTGYIHTERAMTIERYSRSADGERLDLELTMVDPMILTRTVTTRFGMLSFPDIELQEFDCEARSGEF